MSIHITLTASEERKLAEFARATGKDSAGYAHDVVSAYLKAAGTVEFRSIEEIVSPIWDQWRGSGLTDPEIDELLDQELHALRLSGPPAPIA